jgi:hypothetical protein
MMSSFLLSPFQLKQLPHTTVQESLFRPEDIFQFVASKVPEGMPAQVNLVVFSSAALPPYAGGVLMVFSVYLMQDTRNISDAVAKLPCGMTMLLGSFVKEVGEARMHEKDTSDPSLRRSKRQMPIQIEVPEDEEDSEHEQELDDEEDEWEDIDTEEDEDDEGEEYGQADGEDGEEEENKVEEERTKKRSSSNAQANNPTPKRRRLMNSDSNREARHPHQRAMMMVSPEVTV